MSEKIKYSLADRLLAVRSVLEDNLSFRQAGGLIGADHRQVRWWVAHYRAYGEKALEPSGRVPYSLSFKLRVLEDIQSNGLSLLDASLKYRVASQSTLYGWLYRYKKDGEKAFLMEKRKKKMASIAVDKEKDDSFKSRQELLRELELMRCENTYLKKLDALVQQRITLEKGKK